MRATVPQSELAEAVGFAARALPGRPGVPALAAIALHAGTDGLRCSAFDQETAASARAAAEIEDPGATLVPGRLLADIVARLPREPITLTLDGPRLRLRGGGVRFALATLPAGERPAVPPAPPAAGRVDTAALAAALTQVAVATGRDETLPVLTTISLHADATRLRLAATDRFRIAVRDLPWTSATGPSSDATAGPPDRAGHPPGPAALAVLAPARPLLALVRALRAPVATLAASDGLLGVRTDDREVLLRLVDAPRLDYLSRFPTTFLACADLPTRALAEAVRRVALVAAPTAPVRLNLSPGLVSVEADTAEQAEAAEALPTGYRGEPVGAAYTPRYLTDVLSVIDTDRVLLHLTGPDSPTLITGPDGPAAAGLRYLVAPRRPAGAR